MHDLEVITKILNRFYAQSLNLHHASYSEKLLLKNFSRNSIFYTIASKQQQFLYIWNISLGRDFG